jgi:hypothetical protein
LASPSGWSSLFFDFLALKNTEGSRKTLETIYLKTKRNNLEILNLQQNRGDDEILKEQPLCGS